jgi:glycosyltransferase involved in cell wall biosynthesis
LVSAIIPARNEEATIAGAIQSLASQSEIAEIVVVNDQSSDSTRSVVEKMAESIPKLKILDTVELPKGWVGKNYAVSIGAAAASGEWLLLTDADTVHLAGSAARALANAKEHRADLVSYSPEQEMGSLWERAVIPFVYSRLAQLYPYQRINDPAAPDAAANGQFILVRRARYEELGGHRAIASQVLEDVALAKRAKERGYRLYFASGKGIVRTRMYHGFQDMWQGWTKNLYALVRAGGSSVARELIATCPAVEVALFLAGFFNWRFAAAAGVLLAGRWMLYAIRLNRNGFRAYLIFYYLISVSLYAVALVTSAWRNKHGRIAWKGREYPAQTI